MKWKVLGVFTHRDHRKLIDVIPDDVKKAWNKWAVPGIMITSLTFQIILMLGNRRRYYPKARYRFALWHAYSLKSSVASTALGMITQTVLDSCTVSKNIGLETLWASIIYYHLCDSNNITAYSLEENDHWLRHLGEQLLFPLGLSIYVLLLSWPACSLLTVQSLFVHLASFVKCFERVEAQRLANTEHIRESISCPADTLPVDYRSEVSSKPPLAAYNLFQSSKSLFFDLPCQDNENSVSFFSSQHTADEVFHVVDMALGYAYDFFYTNISQLFTIKGQLLHAVDVLFILWISVTFYILCDTDDFKTVHVAIISMVFALEVIKKIHAFITMIRSDWTDLFLIQHNLSRNILIFRFLKDHLSKKRWSNTISQLDFISVVTEEMPAWFLPLQKYFGIDEYLEKHRYRSYIEVPALLESLIYKHFLYVLKSSLDPKDVYIQKGKFSLKKNKCDSLLWTINEVEFHESILIWHFATTLYYYSTRVGNQVENLPKASKLLSDYLMNLLVSKNELLPEGPFGMIRYTEACTKAKDILDHIPANAAGKVSASKKLLAFSWNGMPPTDDQCESLLFKGCKLALALKGMEEEKDMWEVITQVWIEMLSYAAANCKGVHHSRQLRRGGEFLTHVWFLMVGFSIFN